MVGDDARFDYVVFEYYLLLHDNEKKLTVLANRVRARFPDAVIIFLMMPTVGNYIHIPTKRSLNKVMEDSGVPFKGGNYVPTTMSMMHQGLFNASRHGEWALNWPKEQTEEVFRAAHSVDGHVWTPVQHNDPRMWQIQRHAMMFFQDGKNEAVYSIL